jgi:UDP-GlcNAc:undecaprenyl-phosphate/decaprenyl-phosphate GlcNAc-1-phosphate transferase
MSAGSWSVPWELGLVALASAAATALLARLAPRLGWTDAPQGSEAARKRQGRPVPAVGGAALLAGLAVAFLASGAGPWSADSSADTSADAGVLWSRWLPAAPWRLATLALAFAAGALDDRRSLAPGRKVVAQALALAPLALGAGLESGPWPALALFLLGLVALNLVNTFDNADGALASLAVLGFAASAPAVSAACLGFLPFNLDAARARNRASRAPSAYLGDAGAFVLGVLVLCAPRAAGLCVLPLLDLARLSVLRWRSGSRPWIGDRRHLAHRLEARGLARPTVALVQCLVALPACVLVARAASAPALAGIGATAALYALALGCAREPAGASPGASAGAESGAPPRELPCPPGERSE